MTRELEIRRKLIRLTRSMWSLRQFWTLFSSTTNCHRERFCLWQIHCSKRFCFSRILGLNRRKYCGTLKSSEQSCSRACFWSRSRIQLISWGRIFQQLTGWFSLKKMFINSLKDLPANRPTSEAVNETCSFRESSPNSAWKMKADVPLPWANLNFWNNPRLQQSSSKILQSDKFERKTKTLSQANQKPFQKPAMKILS